MKKVKRILSLGLILVMIMVMFAACGKDGTNAESKTGNTANEPAGTKTDLNTQTQAPEFVYTADYTLIDHDFTGSLYNCAMVGDYIYSSTYEMIADNTPEGVTPTYEGEYWEYGPVIYRVGLDGSCERIPYEQPQLPEGTEGSTGLNSVTAGPDGKLYLLENIYTYTLEGMPEGIEEYSDAYWEEYWKYYQSEEKYFLKKIEPDGTVLSTIDLSGLAEDGEYFYPYSVTIDNDGNLYVPYDNRLFVLNDAGEKICIIEAENWVENVFLLGDGRVVCGNYGGSGYQLSEVDLSAQAFGEALPVKNVYSMFTGGGDYDFYYTSGVNLYGYDLENGKTEKILNWINCDVNSDEIDTRGIFVKDDGSVVFVESEWDSDYVNCTNRIVTLTRKPASSVPHKETIRLATQYLNWNTKRQIIAFNRSNDQCRIEVQDYSEYNTEEDYQAGMTKLTTELLAGNVPDILDLNGMPVDQLAAKGFLEDLYPYLDADGELSRESLFPSVLAAMEKDGKLYTTCDTFSIFTVMGASSVVGDEPGWTYKEFKAALADMPEGCEPFSYYTTRDEILDYCLQLDLDQFVNWETGECRFDSPEFAELLEFSNSFPAEFNWETYEYSEEDDDVSRITSGRQMLMMSDIYSFDDYQMYKAVFGGNTTFIGFPTAFGTGNMLITNTGYAMSSKCANKECAWQFLREFFTEEYQSQNSWQFPTNKDAFDKVMKTAMTPVWRTDDAGNYVLDENGNKIEEDRGSWSWGSIEIQLKAISQEDVDEIINLINSTTKVMKVDQSIYDIVREQAAAYFEGQKSAQDVAKMIQSKVKIYVNEQR